MLKSTSNKLNSPNLMVKIACSLVRGYKLLLSPWLGMSCRYTPTCSEYMIDALRSQGLIKGLYTGFKRIGRCHPWGGEGYDPVKPRANKNHPHKK